MKRGLLRVPAWAGALAPLLACAPAPASEPWRLNWRPVIEVAAGQGERGAWRQNESRYDYVDDPAVAMTDDGAVMVAWADQARKDVFFRLLRPGGSARPSPPINVSQTGATFSWLPRLALAPDTAEVVYVLWQEIIFSGGSHGGDILFARSDNSGKSFSTPLNLSRSLGGDGKGRIDAKTWSNGSLDILAGPGGLVVAAWTEYDGPLWTSRSTDGGRTFSEPQHVAGAAAQPARGPALAGGADGTILLAWTTGEDKHADIRIAASRDGGAHFGEAGVVAATPGYSDAPKLVVDRGGIVHLVYAEGAAGPFSRSGVVYTRSVDGRRFTAPRLISDATGGAAYPSVSLDGDGVLYVLWERVPAVSARARGLALTVSLDGGTTFTTPMIVPGSMDRDGGDGGQQGLLMRKLAVNDAGNVAVVNSSFVENVRSRVWLMRAAPLRRRGT